MTTDFSQIVFDKTDHSYTYQGQKLISVTRYISKYRPHFDADYWAGRRASERGVDPSVVLQEWEDRRQVAQARGSHVHEHIEAVLRGERLVDDPHMGILLDGEYPEISAFNRFWQRFSTKTLLSKIEWVIGDAEMGLAGTADLFYYSQDTRKLHLLDWKTGGKFTLTNPFQNLLYPFQDLTDSDLNYY